MKILTIAPCFLMAFVSLAPTTFAQTKSKATARQQPSSEPSTTSQVFDNTTRLSIFNSDSRATMEIPSVVVSEVRQAHAPSNFNNPMEPARFLPNGGTTDESSPKVSSAASEPVVVNLKPANSASTRLPASNNVENTGSSSGATNVTQVYRVGVRDVLDIQLTNNPSIDSTLFTVLEGGVLDYPFAGDPIAVAGLTTAEIAAVLQQRVKIFDNPTVAVSVRDYASHAVNVTGFVVAPGKKTLHREAVPLYTILAEAQLLPEAARATITRQGRAPFVVDLKDTNPSSTLIIAGDAIKVSTVPTASAEFFFIGGEINSPGQKPYHAGITLTQAILASGGTSQTAGSKVKVSRQGVDGKLTTEEFNLRSIQMGKLADPLLQKGDRIEVTDAQ
jgi:protein involved in polysaccharide export with SLBB domain